MYDYDEIQCEDFYDADHDIDLAKEMEMIELMEAEDLADEFESDSYDRYREEKLLEEFEEYSE